MKVKRIDHVGVVVRDLESATRLLEHDFGLGPIQTLEREDLEARFVGVGDGDARIELIDVHDPDARRERLGGDGVQARIEHIAIEVDDLDQTLAVLAALGIETTAPPREAAGALSVWTVTPTSGGIGLQFMQRVDTG